MKGGENLQSVVIRICGIVQGVGFRPFVAVTADKNHIKGTVANKGSYVEIKAKGEENHIRRFADEIKNSHPERAVILSFDVQPCEDIPFEDFHIIESEKEYGDIFVSPDIAVCPQCKKELFDPRNRRYLHPFINCTQCGPRLTILDKMPYDRERTSMAKFPMCKSCEEEYFSPETRRYDAQPVCCNDCGPQVYVIGKDIKGAEAISLVRKEIMSGKIAAVKGIGGFHLCCNAYDSKACARLRKLKNRPAKPFAVMMKDLSTVRRECEISPAQEKFIDGWQKPVMLLKKRVNSTENRLCEEISPHNPTVGVMLPYSPLHMLLFSYPDDVEMTDCLVMTSANARGAPICRCDEDALNEISDFCDIILSHNRDILIRADDSVCDWLFDKPYMIRRSRGFSPLPVMLDGINAGKDIQVLAVGGELKNTFCAAKNSLFYPSPYVGDMGDIRTVKALGDCAERMLDLLECSPQAVVCDLHPAYNTTAFAQEYAQKNSLPLVQVQHHYAHILSCMAENNYREKVIGVSFDGTGMGTDKTIWGGEFLLCSLNGFERAGSIEPFTQAGGDISAKEGWRIAVQLIYSAEKEQAKAQEMCSALGLCDEKKFVFQKAMADKRINCVDSTSCGRLFDGVSAILGIRNSSSFEGEASMSLEFAAERYEELSPNAENSYEKSENMLSEKSEKNNFFILNTTQLAYHIAKAYIQSGFSSSVRDKLAYEFHAVLADMICAGCEKIRQRTALDVCALSGGVFQNRLLTKLTVKRLSAAGFKVLTHSLIPTNDGGIALGQALYAYSILKQ